MHAPSHAARHAMPQGIVVVSLTLLLGLQPITTDLYLPALPLLAHALDAPASSAQLTLSALIICFGVAQLFWGPVSDRIGRRPALLAGLGLYCIAAIGAVLAPTMGWSAVRGGYSGDWARVDRNISVPPFSGANLWLYRICIFVPIVMRLFTREDKPKSIVYFFSLNPIIIPSWLL